MHLANATILCVILVASPHQNIRLPKIIYIFLQWKFDYSTMKQYMRWSNVFNHIRNVVIMKYHIAVLETECNGATIRLTDRESLVNEVEGQLKKLAITASNRKDHVFLSINTNRQGFISKENLRALVSHHHLPADPDIIDGVSLLPHTPHST